MESDILEFDKASNITKEISRNDYHIDSTKRGEEVRDYSYDNLDQLTGVVVTRMSWTNIIAYLYRLPCASSRDIPILSA